MNASSRPLDHSLMSGIAWTALLRWVAQAFSWAATFYVARLLVPGDYGLVAMATLAVGLARMVEDFGMDAVLVQDRSIVGESRARLAGFILALSVVLCGVFAAFAPLVAHFFDEPRVAPLITVLSLLFITDALQVVPRAELQRRMEFRRLAMTNLVQVVVTQVALIACALNQMGPWALVWSQIAGALAVTILLFAWNPYAIAWPSGIASLTRPLLQGWRMLGSRAAWYAYTNADQTIIGRVLGKDALGAYAFATTFSTLAQQEVGSIVTKVVPGIFSEVQDTLPELRRYFLLLTEFLSVLMFPMAIGMALIADHMVPVVLGPQWDAVVAPLRLLCIYSVFLTSQLLVSHILMWTGQFRANLWCSMFAGIGMPLAFLIAVPWGLEGIAMAWVIAFPVFNLPSMVIAFRTLRFGFGAWLSAIWPALAACLLMAAAVIGIRILMPTGVNPWVELGVMIGTGGVVYVAALAVLFRNRLRHVLALARALRQGGPSGLQVASAG